MAEVREVVDPLSGEVVSLEDHTSLCALHDRLEGIALEILSVCRAIDQSLRPSRPSRLSVRKPEAPTFRLIPRAEEQPRHA